MTSILKVDSIQNAAGTAAMTIDSSGRILQPAKPAFQVTKLGTDQSISAGVAVKIEWTDVVTDIGGNFSTANNEYTVPVSGMYNLQCAMRGTGTAGTLDHVIVYLHIDGSLSRTLSQLNLAANQLNNSHVNGSVNIYLNAGQVVSFYGQVSGGSTKIGAGGGGAYTYCSGYLIG